MARLVGRSAKLAGDDNALKGPRRISVRAGNLNRRARVASLKDVLVKEHAAVMLGDHVKVLRQGTIGDQASLLLHANNVPRTVQMTCQSARVRTSRWTWVTREDFAACLSSAGCPDQDAARIAYEDAARVGSGLASIRARGKRVPSASLP